MIRFFRTLLPLICTMFLVACSSSNQSSSKANDPKLANLAIPDSIDYRNIVFRGKMIIGGETNSFIPCGTNDQYTLTLSPQLKETLADQTHYPYQELYGELIGYLDVPSRSGFNADYRAQLVVKQINFVADDAVLSCSQPPHPTQALGHSPKWLVSIENQEMVFVPGQYNVAITRKEQFKQQVRYYGLESSVILSPSLCQLQEDGHLYGWVASAKSNSIRYKGCARVSSFDALDGWEGEYQAQSLNNQALNIKLTLGNTHEAITRYFDNRTQSEIVERGYWQILNATQIEVVMTQNQGQYLVSRRIFDRIDGGIKTDQEKIGQQLYPIGNGGMQLFKVEP
ncbi:hypothetical protein ACXJY6_16360 [Vibrio sp. RC27]